MGLKPKKDIIERYKARLVVIDFIHNEAIDYRETFPPFLEFFFLNSKGISAHYNLELH